MQLTGDKRHRVHKEGKRGQAYEGTVCNQPGYHLQAFLLWNRAQNLPFCSEIGYIFCLFGLRYDFTSNVSPPTMHREKSPRIGWSVTVSPYGVAVISFRVAEITVPHRVWNNLYILRVWSERGCGEKCISDVVIIGSINQIFHLSKLWKTKFFILCDAIILVRLQGKFAIDHSWE